MGDLRTRISVLWIWMAVAISAHSLLFLSEPGGIEKITSGELKWGAWMLFFDALFWLIPLVMAFLSVTLRNTADRWVNMILGGIFTVFNIGHLIKAISYFGLAVHQILIVGSTVVATALIFWYALRWPRQQERVE
jgi:hypothetical protein